MDKLKLWLTRSLAGIAVLFGIAVVSLLVYQQFSDGPTGPLTGGSFRSGELVTTPVNDLSVLEGDFEFELVNQGTSRTAGGVLVDGNLYITCDLGFVWARLPSGMQRNVLHTIWAFKTWHKRAVEDGRIRIRKDGRIYNAMVQRVEDPALTEELKVALEQLAGEFFGPEGLGPRPVVAPNDIWFFRVELMPRLM